MEEAVLAEREAAAVVIGKRLIDGEKNVLSGWVGKIGIGGRRSEFGNDGLQLGCVVPRIVHKKTPVIFVIGMKRETKEAGFTARGEASATSNVQKGSCGARAIALNNLNVTALFDDKQTTAGIVGL